MEEGRFAASGARREVEGDDGRWIALEAWRGRDGRGLCYFLAASDDRPGGDGPDDGDGPGGDHRPGADDRRDRRAILEAGASFEGAAAAELKALLREAAALTATERRFADARGELWLAQNVGPVWAEGDVAAGLTGILFTRLTGRDRVRVSAPGGHVGGMGEDDLRSHLRRALRRREASGEEAPPGGAGDPAAGRIEGEPGPGEGEDA